MTTERCRARSAPIREKRAQPLALPGGFTSGVQVLPLSWVQMKIQSTHYFRFAAPIESLRLEIINPYAISN